MTAPRDLVHAFAEHAASIPYAALPEAAREAAKKSILDTLGVMLAASGLEPAVRGVIEIVQQGGGAPECSVLAFGGRVPALMAALANGALAHCLDYDDQTPWGQHCASTIVPAVFAMAEQQGGVTGQELITAVAVGQDIFARLRCNVGWKKDWNLSTVLAVYAATAAAGRVAGLSAVQIGHAMGIASMGSSGIMEMVAGRGSDLRGLYAGFSAKGAVLAVSMARKGVTGIDQLFEGRYGVFASYFGGEYDRAAMLSGLGVALLGSGTLYKRWPCVGTAHSHMKAAIDIVTAYDLCADDIAEIKLHVGDYHNLMCQPLAERRAPATLADAKFSLPFLVAIATVRRGMSVTDFTQTGLHDPAILDAGRKISLVADSALDWKLELPPGRVEIRAKDGRNWLLEGHGVPGNADNPMSWDDLAAKFRECAAVSVNPVSPSGVERAVALARILETRSDATDLIRSLG
ncbi:MAG: MmgE/PrpD family protein [Rhodobacteraceae bacterium PARR1]|nr:MAG: MmgE/PrpD family protein [Rhodobacteraceae bacterium PARR1]